MLVLLPRLEQIDGSARGGGPRPRGNAPPHVPLIMLPLILPAVVSAFLIALTASFDEYAVASFVAGSQTTFPIYLYGALRFPSRLPR